MYKIKRFARGGKELESQIQTIQIFCQDIGMEFRIEKCVMLIIKKQTVVQDKENYKYLENNNNEPHQIEIKEKVRKEHLKRIRNLLEIKLCCKNIIKGINTSAVSFVRHLGLFLK